MPCRSPQRISVFLLFQRMQFTRVESCVCILHGGKAKFGVMRGVGLLPRDAFNARTLHELDHIAVDNVAP
jgi:hypothetical protein